MSWDRRICAVRKRNIDIFYFTGSEYVLTIKESRKLDLVLNDLSLPECTFSNLGAKLASFWIVDLRYVAVL